MDYASVLNPANKTQTENAFDGQVKNNAGGYVFKIDPWKQLERFLVLGTEGGTYYVTEKKLTEENARGIVELLKLDGKRLVGTAVAFVPRIPKRDTAIFVLALACARGDVETKALARDSINLICHTGTHFFTFLDQYKKLGGKWGSGMRKACAKWYTSKPIDKAAYQIIKYRNRAGYTHRDALRLTHAHSTEHNNLFRWTVGKQQPGGESTILPAIIHNFERVQAETNYKEVLDLLPKLPWEALPTEYLAHKEVWEALLPDMGVTAMTRNLAKMTSIGLLGNNFDEASKLVCSRLTNAEEIKASKIHPMQILFALKTYASGKGFKGSLSWNPVENVVAALEDAFYLSFGNVESTGKNHLLSLDVSGSMGSNMIANSNVSAREASIAMALIAARSEENTEFMAFSQNYVKLGITKKTRLDAALSTTKNLPFDRTDCSLPMKYAGERKIPVDAFVVYTDNETFAGAVHPCVALEWYRQKMGRNAKLIVVGMTSTGFTIADPKDVGSMDVVGFDTAVPQVMRDFVMG